MIRGNNDSNRETSDAPLWLAVAIADYIKAAGSAEILSARAGAKQRPVLEIIESIAHYYQVGTGNGIFADKESNLIYSPPHYTWMDTNYPAGSPRAGYPIEIQALWFALQNMLGDYIDKYKNAAELTRRSIEKYFYLILQVLSPNEVRERCNMKEVYKNVEDDIHGGKRLSGISIENDQ